MEAKDIYHIGKTNIHSDIWLSKIDNKWFKVEKDIEYKVFGGTLIVPKDFITDLASIPQIFENIFPKHGLYDASAILHDYLYSGYSEYNINRADSDIIFYKVMLLCNVDDCTANTMYKAVRLGGDNHYVRNKYNGNYPVDSTALVDKRKIYVEYKKQRNILLPLFEEGIKND